MYICIYVYMYICEPPAFVVVVNTGCKIILEMLAYSERPNIHHANITHTHITVTRKHIHTNIHTHTHTLLLYIYIYM